MTLLYILVSVGSVQTEEGCKLCKNYKFPALVSRSAIGWGLKIMFLTTKLGKVCYFHVEDYS